MQDLHFIFSALLSLFSVFHFSSGNSFEGNVFIIIFEIPQLEASTVHHVLKWQDNRMENVPCRQSVIWFAMLMEVS